MRMRPPKNCIGVLRSKRVSSAPALIPSSQLPSLFARLVVLVPSSTARSYYQLLVTTSDGLHLVASCY